MGPSFWPDSSTSSSGGSQNSKCFGLTMPTEASLIRDHPSPSHHEVAQSPLCGLGERLVDVLNYVIDRLEPYGQPHEIIGDSGGRLFLGGQLGVSSRGGMDGERLRGTRIGPMG